MDLKPNGSEIMVTNENKREYIEYVCTHLLYLLCVCACVGCVCVCYVFICVDAGVHAWGWSDLPQSVFIIFFFSFLRGSLSEPGVH